MQDVYSDIDFVVGVVERRGQARDVVSIVRFVEKRLGALVAAAERDSQLVG